MLNCCFEIFTQQEHFVEVLKHQEFLLLSSEEVSKLLSSDNLNVPSEEVIFQVRHSNALVS